MQTIKNKICVAFLLLFAATMFSCNDLLEEKVYDKFTDYTPPADDRVPVDNIYSALLGNHMVPYTHPGGEYIWFLESLSSDEVCVPLRGSTWYDFGDHRELQQHNWAPNEPNNTILAGWNYAYSVIGACNLELQKGDFWGQSQQAQIRLVRAYAYMKLLDWFGNVPIGREGGSTQMPVNSKRAEVYAFIKSELEDPIMDKLLKRKTSDIWGEYVMRALRIRLYLNSNVYLGALGNPLTDTDPVYVENLKKVIAEADSIIACGKFRVADNYFASFYKDNELPANNMENILTITYDEPVMHTVGNYLSMLTLPNQFSGNIFGIEVLGNCVNGPCVNPGVSAGDPNATYNIFAQNDIRRLSMLTGPTTGTDAGGTFLSLRDKATNQEIPILAGQPQFGTYNINLTPHFSGGFGSSAGAYDGARMVKYELYNGMAWEMNNDLVLIRYTEVLYSKAEALIRLGQDATSIFQEVLSKRGYNGKYLAYDGTGLTIDDMASKRNIVSTGTNPYPVENTLDFMEKELRREFIFEGHRRTDMIRFGKFLGSWGLKSASDGVHRTLYSIPDAIRASQLNVKQNPGYPGYDGWAN
jgi:hypothetical protein